jgi:tetratricopeptide (TPR) repeat protein
MELLAGDAAAAAEFGEEGCRLLDGAGERSWLSSAACTLAQALYALGRFEEAAGWISSATQLGASDDLLTQILWRQVRGKLLAQEAAHQQAAQFAQEAVAIAESTDMLNVQGDAYSDLAEVFTLGTKIDHAAAAVEQALGLYKRKGNLVMAERSQTRLTDLRRIRL